MKLKSFFSISFFLVSFGMYGQVYNKKEIKEVLVKTYQSLERLESLSYKIVFNSLDASGDTSVFEGFCNMQFQDSDKIKSHFRLNYTFKGQEAHIEESVNYDGNYIENNNKIASPTYYNVSTEGYKQFYGRAYKNLIFNQAFSLKTFKDLNSFLGKKLFIEKIIMSDTLYLNKECFKITVFAKNKKSKKYVQNGINTYIINKQNFLPLSQSFTGSVLGVDLYELHSVQYLEINPKFEKDYFKIEIVNQENKVIVEAKIAPTNMESIIKNWTIPLTNEENLQLLDLKGKVVILDFWYKSCLPCLVLMPELNKLAKKYKDVIIIGINDIDAKASTLEYLQKNQFVYQSSYAHKINLAETLNVNIFPSTIVIGKDGKIIFIENGYNKNVIKDIEKVIKIAIEK